MDSVQGKQCFVSRQNQRNLVGSCTPKASVGRVSVNTIGRCVDQVWVDISVDTWLTYRPSMSTCRLTSVASRLTRMSDDTLTLLIRHYCHLVAPVIELQLLYSNINLFSLALRKFPFASPIGKETTAIPAKQWWTMHVYHRQSIDTPPTLDRYAADYST